MKELMIWLIGLILGWYGKDWIKKVFERYRARYASTRLTRLRSEKLRNWLIDYYIKNGFEANLFMASINGEKKQIPFLTKNNWFGKCFDTKTLLKIGNDRDSCDVKVDKKFITKRKLLGQTLWDAPFLCLKKISETEFSITIETIKCQYYQYVSKCGLLEEETIKLINRKRKKSPLRDKYARTLDHLINGRLSANGIGVQSLIAFKSTNGYEFLLQKRSDKLCIAPGYTAVVPCFGCIPWEDSNEESDILLFNFLKEFYEELYNQEELIENTKRLREDWFFDREPIRTLLELKRKGEFTLHAIGFGFDALTAEVNISLLAQINNTDFIKQELRRMQYNWEIKGIETINQGSKKMAEWLKSGELLPSCAFAISNALKIISKQS